MTGLYKYTVNVFIPKNELIKTPSAIALPFLQERNSCLFAQLGKLFRKNAYWIVTGHHTKLCVVYILSFPLAHHVFIVFPFFAPHSTQKRKQKGNNHQSNFPIVYEIKAKRELKSFMPTRSKSKDKRSVKIFVCMLHHRRKLKGFLMILCNSHFNKSHKPYPEKKVPLKSYSAIRFL